MKLTESWHKSSKSSGNGNCVEVQRKGNGVDVRDSKDPNGPTLSVSAGAWSDFLVAIARDEL